MKQKRMQSGGTKQALKNNSDKAKSSGVEDGLPGGGAQDMARRWLRHCRQTGRKLKAIPGFIPFAIFALAFALRYIYNAVLMEHRIAHFGDAYNFLRSGTCLLEAVMSCHNPAELISKIYHAAAPQAQLLQSMTSMKLTDRLLIDGPVYPAYLALIEFLSGVNPFNPIFDSHTVQLSLCNSVLDAFACVLVYACGRLGFNRACAIVAALLFALYPGAIINTQHCYSEPFTYFLLNAWTALVFLVLLRHRKGKLKQAAAWAGIGLCSGLLMLSKPAFILLPAMVALAVLPFSAGKHFRGRLRQNPKDSEQPGKPLAWFFNGLAPRYLKNAASALIGLVLVLTPWVLFNKAASGQYSVFVNRVPSFNIFHGNQIATDGWRCYPFYGCFPGDSKLVIASLLADARVQPSLFVGLQFKKMARLWSGVWNEYHYPLFGIPLALQSLFHQLLLLSAILGLSYLLFGGKNKTLSRSFSSGLVLGVIVLFHFAYIPFEAISRYAVTAMPAVSLLAALLIVEAGKTAESRRTFLSLLVLAAMAFAVLAGSGHTANWFAGVLPARFLLLSPFLSVLVDCLALYLCFAAGVNLLIRLQQQKTGSFVDWRISQSFPATLVDIVESVASGKLLKFRAMYILPAGFAALAASVAGFYTIQSHDWSEWHCAINSSQYVKQTIAVPQLPAAASAFVLLDLGAATLSPPIDLKLNGKTLSEQPLPLAQLQANNADILQCLAIQGEGMGLDLRSFRNWWVVPCAITDLKEGPNSIELRCPDDSAGVIVYGDFTDSKAGESGKDGACFLPSLRSFSYTKGFTTFDHRDARVFEKLELQGRTVESRRIVCAGAGKNETGDTPGKADYLSRYPDLSETNGRQRGRYRIRLLVPVAAASTQNHRKASPSKSDAALSRFRQSPLTLVASEHPQLVEGRNPASFLPATPAIAVPSGLAEGTRFNFSCQLRSLNSTRPYFVSLTFSGKDASGALQAWSSKWQPIAIAPSCKFKTTSFADSIPPEILALRDLQIHPMFSPFQPDLFFLKKAQALKSKIEVRNANLRFLAPLQLPPLDQRNWQVY